MSKPRLFAFIFAAVLCFSSAAPAQNAYRAVAPLGDFYLSAAVAGDGVWLFEISEGETKGEAPFHLSPMISPAVSPTAPESADKGWLHGATLVELNQDPPSIRVMNGEEEVFVINPYAPDGQLAGIGFSGDYSHLLGLGADYRLATDVFNLLGETVMPGGPFGNRRLTRQGYHPNQVQIPVLYALGAGKKSTAIFVDETRPLMWSFKNSPWVSAVAGPLGPEQSFRFFVILGDGLPSLRRNFMNLTGKPPVPPRAAFGVWASEMGDGADSDWQAKISALKNTVPGLTGLCAQAAYSAGSVLYEVARANNLKVMLDESAYLRQNSNEFSEMALRSYLVKDGGQGGQPLTFTRNNADYGLIDYTNDVSHTFWHSLKRQAIIEDGFSIYRLTDGDLEDFSANAWYEGGPTGHSHYAWANAYSLKWLEGIGAGLAGQWIRSRPRLFLLSRTGLAGLTRLAGALYNGESFLFNTRSLTAIKAHLALSGVDYYSSELGPSLKTQPLERYEQMYDLWLAQNALTDVPLILPESLLLRPVTRYNLALRESLLPYYYSLAWEAHLNGDPIFAPLAYHFQEDSLARDRVSELMLGQWLLAGLRVEGTNNERSSVYLPAGQWYNWRTGELIEQKEGGPIVMDAKDAGYLTPPLLAKAGAIIPAVEELSAKSGPPVKIPALKIFIGQDTSTFTWYEDDGESQDYLNGQYGKTVINAVTGQDKSTTVTLKAMEGSWEGAPKERQLLIDIYGPKAPGEASLDKLPHKRVARPEELDELDSGWVSLGNNRIRFKTPPLDVHKDHVLWFK